MKIRGINALKLGETEALEAAIDHKLVNILALIIEVRQEAEYKLYFARCVGSRSPLIPIQAYCRTPAFNWGCSPVRSGKLGRVILEKPPEYANKGIPEYWIIDPITLQVTVCLLDKGRYSETVFTGTQRIISLPFPDLTLTAEQVLSA